MNLPAATQSDPGQVLKSKEDQRQTYFERCDARKLVSGTRPTTGIAEEVFIDGVQTTLS